MKRKLPPFAAIRAFEATARLQSFTAAADELCVTQSAISHQVRGLEEFLGVILIDRKPSGVVATPDGKVYLSRIVGVLDELAAATQEFDDASLEGNLTVTATPMFISRWLLSRLPQFNLAYPMIQIDIKSTDNPMQFHEHNTDILIQYGNLSTGGLSVYPFLTSTRSPVCSPGYLASVPPIDNPADLAEADLLASRG